MAGMDGIGGVGRAGPANGPRITSRGGGFRLPAGAKESTEAAAAQAATPLGLMALQEAEDAAARDRCGAARARDMLKELSSLQAEMLRGAADPARLERLARLAEGEAPADAVLADALASIALRARIELARRSVAAR
ncbi:flagellar assembly protein FliX [Roseomonas harenae]|uniref:flagellar assembly protein FliX n=1 Tax=Muricoccus harenae TaxID=2692566 RepID=UPI0013319A8A|nr:flagellar assembly protein FliX [Roseomonas harenae]